MNCANCGNAVGPGVRDCPFCGNAIYNNNFVYASITLSWEDARKGGVHELTMQNMVNPLRVRVKPRTRGGDKIRVAGAMFSMADESVMLAPVEVTVHVERRPLWQPLLAVLVCVLMTAAAGMGIWTVKRSGGGTPQQNIATTISTTAPTQPSTIETTLPPTNGDTQPEETETTAPITEPEETETTAPITEPEETETTAPPQPARESVVMHYEMRPLLQQLTEDQLVNLEAIYQAMMNFEDTVMLPREIQLDEIDDLVKILHYECPELMQLDIMDAGTYYYNTDTGIVSEYDFNLAMSENEYEEMYEACTEVIDRLVAQTRGMTDWEKERFVFDYITSNCRYDMHVTNAGNAYGTLIQKIAKCDGISFATKWILEEMGITCIVVSGDPTEGDVGHAWNYVLLDGEYYGLDVTADVRKSGDECPVLYCAFNVSTEVVEQSYILRPYYVNFVRSPEVTTMEKSFHAQNGGYFAAGEDWKPYLQTEFLEACQNDSSFILQFETEQDYRNFQNEVGSLLRTFWRSSGISGSFSWNGWYIDEFRVYYVNVSIS